MKIVAKHLKRVINEDGYTELTLVVENRRNQELIKELETGKEYRVELNEVKARRTIEQNKLMWAVIHDIALQLYGARADSNSDWEIYLMALERAGAKYEYIAVLPQAEPILKEQFRAIKKTNSFEHKGKTFNSYKVYYGSSVMNTKEMTLLLETVLDIANEVGIDTSIY